MKNWKWGWRCRSSDVRMGLFWYDLHIRHGESYWIPSNTSRVSLAEKVEGGNFL